MIKETKPAPSKDGIETFEMVGCNGFAMPILKVKK